MKKGAFHSLRFDLIFDLSLLTFCALILSQGIVVILLRMDLPSDLKQISHGYMKSVHENFSKSKLLVEQMAGETLLKDDQIESSFNQFLHSEKIDGEWATLNLKVTKPAIDATPLPAAGEFSELSRKFLIFLPTTDEFIFRVPGIQGRVFTYAWSLQPFHHLVDHFKYRSFLLALLIEAILVCLGYILLFRRNILVPINNLSKVAEAFLAENWSARCEIQRFDELGSVAGALNEMAEKIQEKEKKLVLTIESLKKANEEIEAAQNEQLQIEKLASIGRLAAGVAHEVGNPLGAIAGYIDILRRAMQKTGGAKEDIELCDRIEAETNRISKIIRALLQQARPAKDRIRSVLVKDVIVRTVSLAQIPPSIDVIYDFEDEAAEVLAEQDQLIQVFLNILVNARHAIDARADRKEAGRLTIKCRARKLPIYRSAATSPDDYDTSIVRSLKPEVYWVISIEDNGVGISEQDQKKLFEPFFSTKAPGKGTGLGLYVTKSIVESFRGAIVVRSALNYGASFSIFLPRTRASTYLLDT